MDMINYLTYLAALVFVLALLLLVTWIMRRLGYGTPMPAQGRQRRLAIVEALPIDTRRRLVLVRRDDVEHLLLVGPDGDTVVEGGIRTSFRAVVAATAAAESSASGNPAGGSGDAP